MAKKPDTNDADLGKPANGRRRRSRAPVPVILRLHSDLKANDSHPLANLDPVVRSEQREKLIASILARLANGRSAVPPALDTMQEERRKIARTRESSEAG